MKIMTANIDKSIIKDWTGLKDWELQILVEKGYEKAINEMKRRESK